MFENRGGGGGGGVRGDEKVGLVRAGWIAL